MSIPTTISKEHIESAIAEINKSNIPGERLSYQYFLKVREKMFPPKYVVSIANKYANGKELNSESFNAIEAKNFLIKLGFEIIEKQLTYYDQLLKFLTQAKTNDLTTSHYEDSL